MSEQSPSVRTSLCRSYQLDAFTDERVRDHSHWGKANVSEQSPSVRTSLCRSYQLDAFTDERVRDHSHWGKANVSEESPSVGTSLCGSYRLDASTDEHVSPHSHWQKAKMKSFDVYCLLPPVRGGGVYLKRGLHREGVGQTPFGYYGVRSTSGRYASYWNASLFFGLFRFRSYFRLVWIDP